MTPFAWLVLLLPLLVAPSVAAHGGPQHHGPHVADVHYPDMPARGEPVPVQVRITNATDVSEVRLVHCRVQNYACGPAIRMSQAESDAYHATIPWTGRFFGDVTRVGIRIELQLAGGEKTHSPLEHYPERPAELPPEADTYYYYALAEESPAPALLLVLASIVLAAGRMRR